MTIHDIHVLIIIDDDKVKKRKQRYKISKLHADALFHGISMIPP
jgi:hypothetical protein